MPLPSYTFPFLLITSLFLCLSISLHSISFSPLLYSVSLSQSYTLPCISLSFPPSLLSPLPLILFPLISQILYIHTYSTLNIPSLKENPQCQASIAPYSTMDDQLTPSIHTSLCHIEIRFSPYSGGMRGGGVRR